MRGKRNSDLRLECERLRAEKRMSFREISILTGAPRGSLSAWLRNDPLTNEEIGEKKRNKKTTKKERGEESKFFRVCDVDNLTRSQKNKIAEAAILFRLVLHGFEVFGSVFDGDKTDWLARKPKSKSTIRIEVKWTRLSPKYGLPFMKLICTEGHGNHRRYEDDDFDVMVGYDLFTDTAYVYRPEDIVKNKRTVTVSSEFAERWDKLHQ
jgi:hypothetical protein